MSVADGFTFFLIECSPPRRMVSVRSVRGFVVGLGVVLGELEDFR